MNLDAWDLEIATDTDRLRQVEGILKRSLPALDLLGKTRFFAVWGCTLAAPLTEQQKGYLEELREGGMIYRWRCGKQKT